MVKRLPLKAHLEESMSDETKVDEDAFPRWTARQLPGSSRWGVFGPEGAMVAEAWVGGASIIVRALNAYGPMRDALRAVEWAGGASADRCPFCNRTRAEGHREECRVAAAPRAARMEE